ncbi:hypothetical protein Tco_0757231 [Tanacetum coccineum]
MDDPNMTMDEYIKFEEEKARRRGRVFNWQTATYGKIRVDDNLRSVEAEFPAIVINDAITPQDALQCKSQVSTPINDEIEFRISFDEFDDEDYTIICDKNSFSYKVISVNNFKTDSENDVEKIVPLIPSPEPAISCPDDLDFFEDFDNEFSAIVYNDAQTSKSDLLIEPILNHQHIDEFDDETSLPEYDEEEQIILYFNDLFPFNIIHLDDLKSKKDNNDNEIDIILSFEYNESTHGATTLFETSHDKSTRNCKTGDFFINLNVKIVIWRYYANGMIFYLIMNLCAPFGVPFDPKRYYKDGDCIIMLQRPRYGLPLTRLTRIYKREVHRVPVFDFGGLPNLMAEGLSARCLMSTVYDQSDSICSPAQAYERLFDIRGPFDEGDQAVLAPVQAPQQPPPPPPAARTMPQRMARLEEDVQGLHRDIGSLPFQRRTRLKTDGANTSAAEQDPQQPDL